MAETWMDQQDQIPRTGSEKLKNQMGVTFELVTNIII